MRRIRAAGGGTGELSYYSPLNNLLNAVGGSLRPKVYCVSQLGQVQTPGQRWRKNQTGVGCQAMVVEGHSDAIE